MAIDTSNFTNHYFFWPNRCNERSNECLEPWPGFYFEVFLKYMDKSLLNQIEGIVEYYFPHNNISGWVLLFNINGRPKYCFQSGDQAYTPLSAQVTNYKLLCKTPKFSRF